MDRFSVTTVTTQKKNMNLENYQLSHTKNVFKNSVCRDERRLMVQLVFCFECLCNKQRRVFRHLVLSFNSSLDDRVYSN